MYVVRVTLLGFDSFYKKRRETSEILQLHLVSTEINSAWQCEKKYTIAINVANQK